VHPGELIYEAALRAAPPALRIIAPFHEKLRRGLDGRRRSLASLMEWAAENRNPAPPGCASASVVSASDVSASDTPQLDPPQLDPPLVWLHAPSVGEALMAQAILAALRQREPELRSVFTFFSPSAERMAGRVGADWSGYLPWDQRPIMRAAVRALRPTAVAFVRTEIWPVLGREAQRLGARVVLVNAVLAEHSSRMGLGARMILGPAYSRLDGVGAVTREDIPRLQQLGVPAGSIAVTGDARFDQVWTRVRGLDTSQPLLLALRRGPGPRLVAGSTWQADEDLLLPALAAARATGADWRLIIAPHEPGAHHVATLERRLGSMGLSWARLPDMHMDAIADVQVLIVDRVGVLADLYAIADAAYVGGGFGSSGLHSVVEPAALGVPVLFGPRHGHAREAALLAAAGGGFEVKHAAGLGAMLELLHADPLRRQDAGAAARAFVAAHIGGADRNAGVVLGQAGS
jgi:3-deoxy-D-manno-octulosonic-acid transferase